MTALIVILCIVSFFLILLLFPVTVYAQFENELTAKLKYLFFSYKISPEPKAAKARVHRKKQEEEEKKEQTDDTKSKIKDIIKQKGLTGFLSMIKEFASIAAGTAKKVCSHIVISNISTDISVADEDAAETAVLYGYVCAVVCPSIGLLVNSMKCRSYHINIVPDFQSRKCRIRFEIKAHVQLLFLIFYGLTAMIQSLKVLKKTGIISRIQKIKE